MKPPLILLRGSWNLYDLAGMPHRHPALLVKSIEAVFDDGGCVTALSEMDGLQMIEAGAQALAGLAVMRAPLSASNTGNQQTPAGGMLIAVNRVRCGPDLQRNGGTFIWCRELMRLGNMSSHEVAIGNMTRRYTYLSGEYSVVSLDAATGDSQPSDAALALEAAASVPRDWSTFPAMRPFQDVALALGERSLDGNSAQANLCFSVDLPVFAGHFPGRPLVPGVYLLAAILLSAAPGARLLAVERAKWRRPALPGQLLTVHATWCSDDGRLNITGYVDGPDGRCCECHLEADMSQS